MGNLTYNYCRYICECGYVGKLCDSEKDAMESIKNEHLKKVAHTTINKIVEISENSIFDNDQGAEE